MSFYFLSNVFLVVLCLVTFGGVVVAAHKTTKLVWP
jgi:hypothetical protein